MTKFTEIKALLSSPDKWTKGSYAKDKNGRSVNINSPEAVCWCLVGAAEFVCHKNFALESKVLWKIEKELRIQMGNGQIQKWNDAPERTYQDVIDLLEKCEATNE